MYGSYQLDKLDVDFGGLIIAIENQFQLCYDVSMLKEKDVFIGFLNNKGLKFTSQRKLILDAFLKNEEHPSVDDLFSQVRKEDKTIGYATVHRTLKLIEEAGLAREVGFDDKRKRFEHLFGHKHHDHLVCIECGKTIEVFDPKIEKLQENMAAKHGFTLSNHKMEIFGICGECNKN